MRFSLSNLPAFFIASFLLLFMTGVMLFSMSKDSLTFDELAHIPAGYSYLTLQDYRLNPEHPPLAKDIAAFPLLFLDLKFPVQSEWWRQNSQNPAWWVQFNLGNEFLYHSGNNPKDIIFWSRFPMILLTLALGALLFIYARRLGGNFFGIAALILFSFSPSILAHGRLVTTDIGAAFGALFAIFSWLNFLKHPSASRMAWAGVALGIAMLLKFTIILLIPFFALLTLLYVLLMFPSHKLRRLGAYLLWSAGAGLICFLFVIWPVYQFHIWNYPAERQLRDTIGDLQPGGITFYENAFAISLADKPFVRPFAQYFRGVFMATQRGQFGNTVVFQEQIKAGGFSSYFPVVYLAKEPLALHALSLIGLAGILWSIKKKLYQGWKNGLITWSKRNFTILALLIFIVSYWLLAISGNLNIGVRHLLVIFPLIYLVILAGIQKLLLYLPHGQRARRVIIALIILFLAGYALVSLAAYPFYLSYYNPLGGGIQNGYRVAVDSNYDWGQDFYRLLDFVQKNNISALHLDYFGGEDPAYWLGEKYIRYNPCKEVASNATPAGQRQCDPPLEKGWLAISTNQLMGGIAKPVSGFDQPTGYYNWLLKYEPIARAGNSLFIFFLP
ncbi:MAG: hypothetical protein A3C04_04355 [Candidatus Wildermuthbacteria bacterium RIFCSPHIGHO2_02_FULL_45_25]|uniref:Glycosyltransferase RgtA/B/C/D-like domain-containing protein n=1 Tax=Candidatus Wildermuthbacteria bacterium RIFCSPHIGHO2_02_FULL_45_25 TaxID=1802450 RepID=A0A1G2R407_9BACT|nr:MAG: hypothetical protein A3C04_04355 [Candidatus Wildermuthbacteria bacterium RIFCSPHIGHO2_02_FULL_45_25]